MNMANGMASSYILNAYHMLIVYPVPFMCNKKYLKFSKKEKGDAMEELFVCLKRVCAKKDQDESC